MSLWMNSLLMLVPGEPSWPTTISLQTFLSLDYWISIDFYKVSCENVSLDLIQHFVFVDMTKMNLRFKNRPWKISLVFITNGSCRGKPCFLTKQESPFPLIVLWKFFHFAEVGSKYWKVAHLQFAESKVMAPLYPRQ